jgi:diacylglycerol kinase
MKEFNKKGVNMNPKQECKKLINSFKYAIEGFVSSFKTERNMKIHVLAMGLVLVVGLYFKLSIIEWCFITFAISLVIGAELFNTAIETIVDMVSPEKNPKAKLAKDISAAAVLAFAIGSAIVGLIIFMPKI